MSTDITPTVDGQALRLSIDATLNSAQVQELIRQLAMAGAGLQPAAHTDPPQATQRRMLLPFYEMAIEHPSSDGSVIWNIRFHGLGWVGVQLQPAHVQGWVEHLRAHHQLGIRHASGHPDLH